jgi:hypothetical protein
MWKIDAEDAIAHGVDRGRSPRQLLEAWGQVADNPRRCRLPPSRDWRLACGDAGRASPLRGTSCKNAPGFRPSEPIPPF